MIAARVAIATRPFALFGDDPPETDARCTCTHLPARIWRQLVCRSHTCTCGAVEVAFGRWHLLRSRRLLARTRLRLGFACRAASVLPAPRCFPNLSTHSSLARMRVVT